jgi:glycosyltransferase involved in cell wall biosynthesis
VKREIEDSGFSGKVDVIYPYVNERLSGEIGKSEARKELSLANDKTIILSVSSRSQRKNVHIIKDVMEGIGGNTMLVRVGNNLGFGKTFTNISDETLNSVYRAADVLFFPTLDEGFGYPLAEAMANGLPVVTTDLEITREITKDAAVLSESSVEGYTRSIREALNSKEDLSRKSILVSKLYRKDRFSKELQKLYGSLVKS